MSSIPHPKFLEVQKFSERILEPAEKSCQLALSFMEMEFKNELGCNAPSDFQSFESSVGCSLREVTRLRDSHSQHSLMSLLSQIPVAAHCSGSHYWV